MNKEIGASLALVTKDSYVDYITTTVLNKSAIWGKFCFLNHMLVKSQLSIHQMFEGDCKIATTKH